MTADLSSRFYPRHVLTDLPGTPWLVPAFPPVRLVQGLGLGWLGLLLLVSRNLLLLLVVGVVGFLLLAPFLIAMLQRTQLQVCPHCLRTMGRGATLCPSCGFRE